MLAKSLMKMRTTPQVPRKLRTSVTVVQAGQSFMKSNTFVAVFTQDPNTGELKRLNLEHVVETALLLDPRSAKVWPLACLIYFQRPSLSSFHRPDLFVVLCVASFNFDLYDTLTNRWKGFPELNKASNKLAESDLVDFFEKLLDAVHSIFETSKTSACYFVVVSFYLMIVFSVLVIDKLPTRHKWSSKHLNHELRDLNCRRKPDIVLLDEFDRFFPTISLGPHPCHRQSQTHRLPARNHFSARRVCLSTFSQPTELSPCFDGVYRRKDHRPHSL